MEAAPGGLAAYVPRLLGARDGPQIWRQEGTLVFSDLSGFTRLSERLARRGRAGAEELVAVVSMVFTELLTTSDDGGDVLQFGGDGLLLFYDGPSHAERACHSAVRMRQALARVGGVDTAGGRVRLRMSTGIASGDFTFALAGRDLLQLFVVGPDASRCMRMEAAAERNEILLSAATAARLQGASLGGRKAGGVLLRRHRRLEAAGTRDSVERMDDSRAARFVAPVLRERLPVGVESEHRQATVAFVGFGGVDDLAAPGAPGDALERLTALSAAVQAACEELEITIVATDCAVDGGKIMLVAGAPTAGEDADGRMLHACRRILATEVGLPLRAGVNRGHVFCGDVGAPFRRTYGTMGRAVNLAARILERAPIGGLVAARAVAEHSRARFAVQPVPPFSVKGSAAPVEAVLVSEPAPAASAAAPRWPRLVGRDAELDRLARALAAPDDGGPHAVEVVGEPGVGKTRLAVETQAQQPALTPILVTGDRFAVDVPYAGARQLLRRALGIPQAAPASEAARALRSLASSPERVSPERLALLAPVIGAEVTPAAMPHVAPQFREARLHDAAGQLLTAVLGRACILIDDAGALDSSSVALLRAVLDDVGDRPWSVLVTRRPDAAPLLPRAQTVTLAPLARAAVDALLEELAEERPLPAGVLSVIAERSGGNPRFLIELVAAGHDPAGGDLPASVETLLASRIDRLPATDRLVLRHVAVVGVECSHALLARVLPRGIDAEDGALWRRLGAFLERTADGVRFRTPLYRDAAYAGLSYAARRRLHGQVVDALTASPEAADVAALSLHAHAAERHPDAWRFSRLAGDRARTAAAPAEAATAYIRALDAARRLRTLPAAEVAAVAESLGDVAERAGRYEDAAGAYRRARALDTGAEASVRLLRKTGVVRERQGRYPAALRWYSRALSAADALPDAGSRARARAAIEVAYAAVRQRQGRLRASIAWADRAVSSALQGGEWAALAGAYHLLGEAYADLGDARAHHFSDLALPIFEEIGDYLGLGATLDRLGELAYAQGRWVEALQRYERAGAARRRAGDEVGAAASDLRIAEVLSDQGNTAEAVRMLRRARQVFRAAGYELGRALATSDLGLAAVRCGQPEEALRLLDDALAAFAALGAAPHRTGALNRRAEALLALGRAVEAWEAATEALQRSEQGAARAAALRLRGCAMAATGGHTRARECLHAALEHAQRCGARHEEGLAREALADLGGDDAPEHRKQALAILLGLGVGRAIDALQASTGAVPADGSRKEIVHAT